MKVTNIAGTQHIQLDADGNKNRTFQEISEALKSSKQEPAKRFDAGKPRLDLIDPISISAMSQVLAFGASKYGEHNWKGGMSWSRVLGSILRHTFKFMAGEDTDEESGLPHVDHILCNAMFLSNYYRQHKSLDDRFKGNDNDKQGSK